ncbi:phage major capsid protein, partial [Desulfosporosinus sp. SYSU MS00001]|uniref:phage major capsid protein n=1 Tax=Desulfosporosinus sp. SYSU MS00001 TaxID=3416284 RepID=UPI003CEBFBB3
MLLSEQLRAKLENLRVEANALMNKEGVTAEEINAKAAEIDTMKAKIQYQERVEAEEAAAAQAKINNGGIDPSDTKDIDIKQVFAKVVAGKEVTAEEKAAIQNYVVESDPKKGGIGVPADVSTDIKQYQDATRMFDIRSYITVEPVKTMSGSRPYATNQPQASGFAPVDESKAVQAMYEPTFDSMNYLIQKYGGYIPVTNELLEDDASGMYSYLVKWLAENELNTYAYQVFNGTGTKSAQGILTEIEKTTPLNGVLNGRVEKIVVAPTVDKFKSVINVDLETLTTDTIRILTNADGYNYLDSLQDKQGRYYMQP